jgi:hypothetical protein
MRKQNDLDKLLMIISLKEQYGNTVVHAIDKVLGFTNYHGDDFEIMVSDKYMVVAPKDFKSPLGDAYLAIDVRDGLVKIDVLGFYGSRKTSGDFAKELNAIEEFMKQNCAAGHA